VKHRNFGVWKPNVVEAVQIWNSSVDNVRLMEGRRAAMTIYASAGRFENPQGDTELECR
jgi:hypothetical protein